MNVSFELRRLNPLLITFTEVSEPFQRMADPLSVAGSAVAIFGLAVQSCEVLCSFLRSFHEATEDLKHHIATLQALGTTFTSVSYLEQDFPDNDLITQGIRIRSQECLLTLKAIEDLVKPLHDDLQRSRARRAWTKTKWAGANQKQKIERLMARIESYHRIFSLDLLLINT